MRKENRSPTAFRIRAAFLIAVKFLPCCHQQAEQSRQLVAPIPALCSSKWDCWAGNLKRSSRKNLLETSCNSSGEISGLYIFSAWVRSATRRNIFLPFHRFTVFFDYIAFVEWLKHWTKIDQNGSPLLQKYSNFKIFVKLVLYSGIHSVFHNFHR